MATTGTYYHVAVGLFYGEHWDFNGLPIAPHHFSNGGIYNLMENFMIPHQLNRNESSNGFYILRSHFKFTYSVAFSENHGSVTFSENRKSMMSFHRDFPV